MTPCARRARRRIGHQRAALAELAVGYGLLTALEPFRVGSFKLRDLRKAARARQGHEERDTPLACTDTLHSRTRHAGPTSAVLSRWIGSHWAEIRAGHRATQKAVTCETIECGQNRIHRARRAGTPLTLTVSDGTRVSPPSARTNSAKIFRSGRTRRSRAASAEKTQELAATDSDQNSSQNGDVTESLTVTVTGTHPEKLEFQVLSILTH